MRKEIQEKSLALLRSGEKTLDEIETALREEYPNASDENITRWVKRLDDMLVRQGATTMRTFTPEQIETARIFEGGLTHATKGSDDLVTLDAAGSVAWREFEAASKQLRDSELARQAAVERYNAALKSLSRIAAPDPNAAR